MLDLILAALIAAEVPAPIFPTPPTPRFATAVPTPRFGQSLSSNTSDKLDSGPSPEQTELADPTTQRGSDGRLVRLPGPRNWFRCPQCGSSSDLMYLGDHLRYDAKHRKTMAEIEAVGWRDLQVWHDNLHNLTYKPPPATTVKVQASCSTCEGGACEVGPVRRLLRGWR